MFKSLIPSRQKGLSVNLTNRRRRKLNHAEPSKLVLQSFLIAFRRFSQMLTIGTIIASSACRIGSAIAVGDTPYSANNRIVKRLADLMFTDLFTVS